MKWMLMAALLLALPQKGPKDVPRDVPPVDVPSIQVNEAKDCPANYYVSTGKTGYTCIPPKSWTCEDKARVLLTSEDGRGHCIKLSEQ